jgi:KDO2-lipid IV(A) lauroyltransferase
MNINFSSFLQWRFNIFMIKKLGWSATYFYITLLGKLYFFFKRQERWKIISALGSVFQDRKTISEVSTLTEKVFGGILSHYYEKVFNVFSEADALRAYFDTHVTQEGMSALKEGLSKGKGVLMITGHLGGVEYIPLYLGANNYPVTMVVRFSSQRLRQISLTQSEKFGVRVIDGDTTPNIMKAIFSNLKENRIVITQCDEIDEWRPSRKDKIFFLGKQTCLDKTLNILSKRTASSVVFGIMHRKANHHYKFIATSWEEMSRQFQRSVDTTLGAVILKFLERYIYMYPEEWYQWKKYPLIEAIPSGAIPVEVPAAIPLLEPSLSNAS